MRRTDAPALLRVERPGERPSEVVPLDRSPLLVGSSSLAHVRVEHPDAAPVHARICWRRGAWWVEDAGAPVGTELGERRLRSGRWRWEPGTELRVPGARLDLAPIALDDAELRRDIRRIAVRLPPQRRDPPPPSEPAPHAEVAAVILALLLLAAAFLPLWGG